jgi:hypothetical protein
LNYLEKAIIPFFVCRSFLGGLTPTGTNNSDSLGATLGKLALTEKCIFFSNGYKSIGKIKNQQRKKF